MNMTNMQQQNA